jgi:hypothetical protein
MGAAATLSNYLLLKAPRLDGPAMTLARPAVRGWIGGSRFYGQAPETESRTAAGLTSAARLQCCRGPMKPFSNRCEAVRK